ncbi:MAG: hypothetical protein R2939_22635 [Kofleriaceae bacterium]
MLRASTAVAALLAVAGACAHVSTVRLQPENVEVGPGLTPVAAIQANATSAYVLFLAIPGGVDLDRVVNRMLIVAAKTLGADKVTDLRFDVTPSGGVWALRKVLGWRSAEAHGIAVRVEAPVDADADAGPEPAPAP